MKFIAAMLLSAILAFISGLFLPWWGMAITSMLVALLIHQNGGRSFLSGFLGVFLLWAMLAWWIDMKNNGMLSHRIASVLPLGGNSLLLILVTGLIGGLAAGMGALTGSFLRAPKRSVV
jgi:hypothetical protein